HADRGEVKAQALITLAAVGVVFVGYVGYSLIEWAKTYYRVTPEAVEVRTGLVIRRLRVLRLNRIRNVDLTASPLHRLAGVTTLRIGTTASTEQAKEVKLDGVPAALARTLRTELLAHTRRDAARDPLVSAWNPRWIRYAPLTFWVFGGVVIVSGAGYRALEVIGLEPWRIPVVRQLFSDFGASALWLTIPLALLALTLLGVLGAIALYVENWWRFRLEWQGEGLLRVRRGLFTTRSVSVERQRLFGVLLAEPLPLRAGGGASVRVVAGGLGNAEEERGRGSVLPPAPRAEAVRVTAGVLREPSPVAGAELTPHPRVAFRRRVLRGLLSVTLPLLLVQGFLGWLLTDVLLHTAWSTALASVPFVLWLARDAYRSLGHGLAGPYLVTRSGTFSRDTVALRRTDVLAWTFSDTPFSRRAGVVTLTAAVATAAGGYAAPDLDAATAPAFAEEAVPGILTEFLAREGGLREEQPAQFVDRGAGGPVGADGAR
ncbi:PH domain-containing protein, partial [Crossiella equi]|uniref:PH domain-containing protein n=1 Tax=Crossiella equi TaxID=130796 RepID=UPI001177A070